VSERALNWGGLTFVKGGAILLERTKILSEKKGESEAIPIHLPALKGGGNYTRKVIETHGEGLDRAKDGLLSRGGREKGLGQERDTFSWGETRKRRSGISTSQEGEGRRLLSLSGLPRGKKRAT